MASKIATTNTAPAAPANQIGTARVPAAASTPGIACPLFRTLRPHGFYPLCRTRYGTSVMTPTFRYHPAVVAQAFATLGVMFPDRIVLGVGTGESLNEVPSTGMTWPHFKERFARLREAVTLIRRLWIEERVTFEGQYYRTKDATIYDRPATCVPIYIAAAGALIA